MCGIFGIRGHDDAVGLTKLGLFSLQHRGQESAGIVSVEHGMARAVRSMGLVSEGLGEVASAPGFVDAEVVEHALDHALCMVLPSHTTETS